MAENKVQIVITAKDAASPAFNTLSDKIKKASSSLASFAGGMASLYGLQRIAKSAIEAALGMEKLHASMSATMGTGSAREIQFIREESNRLGLAVQETGLAYAKFAASARNTALEGEQSRLIFKGVSEAVTSMRLSADESNGVFLALSQMISKGKVQAEELRGQLGERLPGAFRLSAEALGVTTAELDKMLEKGEVTAEDLLPKLAKRLHETYGKAAVDAAKGGQAEINRFNNAVFETSAALGQALMPALATLMGFLRDMIPVIKPVVFGIQSIGIAAGETIDRYRLASKSFASPATMAYHKLFNTETWQQYQKESGAIGTNAQEYASSLWNRMNPSVSSALPKGGGIRRTSPAAGKAGKGGKDKSADSWARALADMQAEMDKLNTTDLEQKLISLANKAGDMTRQFTKVPGALGEIQKWLSAMSAGAIEQERLETEKKASEQSLKIAQDQAEAKKEYETYVTETTMTELDKRIKAEQKAAEEMVQAQYNALVTEFGLLENEEEFNRRREGIIKASAERIRQIRAEYEEKDKEKTGTFMDGMKAGLQEYLDNMKTSFESGADMVKGFAQSSHDYLSDLFFDPSEASFDGFLKALRRKFADALADMAMQMLTSSLLGGGSWLGSLFNVGAAGAGASGGAAVASFFAHSGGVIGRDNIPSYGVSPGLYYNAPRFHRGLQPDEFPAVLKKGEGVFTPGQMKALGVQATGGGGGNVIVHMNVNAMDAKSFNAMMYENKGALTNMIRTAMKDNHPGRRG